MDLMPTPSLAAPSRGFADLGVPSSLLRVLDDAGVTEPFPIQTATLPDSLAGRDVLGRGKTGSGKTIAFAIPTVVALATSGTRRQPYRPHALILVPTRELANQVAKVIKPLAEALNLRTTTIFGGVGQHPQVVALKTGVDIVIACPGRLEDLMQQGVCKLDAVEVTVLDEADHMADLGFLPVVKRILDRTPAGTQRLLFSATLDNGIDVLVKRYLSNPITHSVDPEVAPVETMTHHVFAIETADKLNVVRELVVAHPRTMLFTRTKHGAKKLAKQLCSANVPAVELHGNLSQNARERNLAAFSHGEAWAMVATDIAARGIHVDDIRLVVHVDPPAEHKAYLHRSGRTARAGAEGVVITLMLPEQAKDVAALARAAGIRPTKSSVRPGDTVIRDLPGVNTEPLAITPRSAPPSAPIAAGATMDDLRPPRSSHGRPGGSGAPGGRRRSRSGSASSAGPGPRSGEPRRSDGPARTGEYSRDGARGNQGGQGRPQSSGRPGGQTSGARADGRPSDGRPGGQGRPAGQTRSGGQGRPGARAGQPASAGRPAGGPASASRGRRSGAPGRGR